MVVVTDGEPAPDRPQGYEANADVVMAADTHAGVAVLVASDADFAPPWPATRAQGPVETSVTEGILGDALGPSVNRFRDLPPLIDGFAPASSWMTGVPADIESGAISRVAHPASQLMVLPGSWPSDTRREDQQVQEDGASKRSREHWRLRTTVACVAWIVSGAVLLWLVERDQIVVATLAWAVWFVSSLVLVFLVANPVMRRVRRGSRDQAQVSRSLPPSKRTDQDADSQGTR